MIAHHFCRHDNPKDSKPINLLISLIDMLCTNVTKFKHALEKIGLEEINKALVYYHIPMGQPSFKFPDFLF